MIGPKWLQKLNAEEAQELCASATSTTLFSRTRNRKNLAVRNLRI
ncbi:MAG TPA: hypothetical protein VF910_07660 [Candidatus Bathyarchaeia archaeon]